MRLYPRMHKILRAILLSFFATAASGAEIDMSKFFKPGALRILILSGRNGHDWRTTTPFMRKLLTDTGRFDVRVCEEPVGLTAAALAPYDALVVDYCGPRWGKTAEDTVESFVRSGKGMLVVHGAGYTFTGLPVTTDGHVQIGVTEPAWPAFVQMLGGSWTSQPAKGYHGMRHSFSVKFLNSEHPIARGARQSFIATDELYHGMTLLPTAKVLATAFDNPEMNGTGKEEPMLWTVDYGKGRSAYIAFGHEVQAMRETGFMNIFARTTEWVASGKVTLAADALPARRPDRLRLLVVTGGHDYEPSFYTVFEGQDDIVWSHATSNQQAFRTDIRSKYDVVALYDMSQELDEKGRANLRDFLEAGKGMVVLHHAIADYQAWPWWYQEVVGGRYLLKPDGNTAASTYKHDVEFFVRPEGKHPITAPIGPIHIMDEAYKGMWIRPENKVLLRTSIPENDSPVAWISPYEKSRVVYIQLGHDSAAYLHPDYRTLVHRAILWTANRLK